MRAAGLTLVIAVAAVAVTGLVVYLTMASQLPDPDITKAKGRDQSTVITDRSGKELAKLYADENRKDVKLSDMPPHLRQAVIATEDKRFYEHQGVDPIGITRALVVDVIRGERAQGGSTITQQYVKQAFVTSEKTLKRKVQEAILAQRVERRYSKDEILQGYLNTIYFGHGAYGVEAASRVYFGKTVSKLNVPESAVLAGVLKSPGRYSPYLEPDAAVDRRDTVLGQMRDQGYLDQAAHADAIAAPIEVVGLKPRSSAAPYFVEWIKEQLIEEYGERMLYRGGLTVKTTLDLAMQRSASKAIAASLDREDDPSAALVAIKPGTGEVLAMVGGRDFKTQQFNVAVQGKRQPGSAFKPFVLATALSKGTSPEQAYESGPIKIDVGSGTWSVTGASGGAKGPMRLRTATEKSVNSVFAKLIMEVGADEVVKTAEKLGVDSGIAPVPAIALGGLEHGVSPLEMAESYATLAAGGKHAEPYGIMHIKDASGEYLFKGRREINDAIDPALAYLTTDILRGVIERGTGTAARIGRQAAGKTGTTQRYRDAWFVGYTPELSTAVWVGYPDSQREMTSVHGRTVTGGSFPAEIWRSFMVAALKNVEATRFKRPGGLRTLQVCSESGGAATEFCPKPIGALVLARSVPGSCTVHVTPERVKVPKLVGLSKEEALDALEAAHLTAKVTERPVAGVAPGIVAQQTPAPGSVLDVDAPVTIVVSAGDAGNSPPEAIFEPPTDAKAGRPTKLDGTGSTDDGTISTFYWEFGDGNTGTGSKVAHVWATPGTYDVTLWVTDDDGDQGSVTHTIAVR
ncbi:MAG: PBP1A family penicillin-binding protein [Coriobacteriia bacterium]|nr:PBP1A family penicillin-binding protein [Coriobacteriia bacterium]